MNGKYCSFLALVLEKMMTEKRLNIAPFFSKVSSGALFDILNRGHFLHGDLTYTPDHTNLNNLYTDNRY